MPDQNSIHAILEDLGSKHGIADTLLLKMLEIERGKLHLERRRGVTNELRLALNHELKPKGHK